MDKTVEQIIPFDMHNIPILLRFLNVSKKSRMYKMVLLSQLFNQCSPQLQGCMLVMWDLHKWKACEAIRHVVSFSVYTREARVTAVPGIPLDFTCGNPSQLIQGWGHWLLFWEGKEGGWRNIWILFAGSRMPKTKKMLNNQNLSRDDDAETKDKVIQPRSQGFTRVRTVSVPFFVCL